jgi:putative component of membrane protein insertase Oxa1/YidC/SpoIIIJ protein YidD
MENLPIHYTPYSLACSSLITRICHFVVTVSRYKQPAVRVGFVMDKMTLGQASLRQLRFLAVSTDWGRDGLRHLP